MARSSASCRHEGCSQPAVGGKGYCGRHYAKWKRGELPKARFKTCRVESCHKRMVGRGRCAEHFARDYPGKQAGAVSAPAAPAEAPGN